MYIPATRELVRARNREGLYFVVTVFLDRESVYLVELNSGGRTKNKHNNDILPLIESPQAQLVSC